MTDEALAPWIERYRRWPKIALHRHLPGSIRFDWWWALVRDRAIALPTEDPATLQRMMLVDGRAPLKEYLRAFDVIDLAFADVAAIEWLTHQIILDGAAEGLIHLELRYSPTRMAQRAGISTAEALAATIRGAERARVEVGDRMEVILIAGLSRELGVARCAEEAAVIRDFAGEGIAAIDLLGNEIDFPARWFAPIFAPIAAEGRLGITIHAGESSGADCVRAAVVELGASRIGHGVRSEEEPPLLDLLRERGITLEMCPTSNVQTQATESYESHPLPRYLRDGLRVTINTDNPCISQVDLAHEYAVAVARMGVSEAELARTLHYAVDAAFLPTPSRDRLRARLTTGLAALDGTPPSSQRP